MLVHEEWLAFALYDLKAAQLIIKSPEAIIPPALVLAQQCAEKALKAYLFYKDHASIKTHDLVQLVKLCMSFDEEFSCLLENALELNPHVSASRYPDSCLTIPDLTTAQLLITQAEYIYNFVCRKIL